MCLFVFAFCVCFVWLFLFLFCLFVLFFLCSFLLFFLFCFVLFSVCVWCVWGCVEDVCVGVGVWGVWGVGCVCVFLTSNGPRCAFVVSMVRGSPIPIYWHQNHSNWRFHSHYPPPLNVLGQIPSVIGDGS